MKRKILVLIEVQRLVEKKDGRKKEGEMEVN